MLKVHLWQRSETPYKDGRAPIYAVVQADRKKIRIPLDIAIAPAQWDGAGQRVRGKSRVADDINLILGESLARINDVLVQARLTGTTPTRQTFEAALAKNQKNADPVFVALAKKHLKEIDAAITWSTFRHHMSALKKLDAYRPGLKLDDITPEFLRVYAAYLRDSHGNGPGTIRKNMDVIRSHYYAAMRQGLTKRNPFEAYKLPRPEPRVIYLREDELKRLIDLYKSATLPENLQDVLRFFLFMAFTGMHISDARSLQIEQIYDDEIHYRRIKTQTSVIVPVSAASQKLIDYYCRGRYRGRLVAYLPTDQTFNRMIKMVCEQAGIHKAVSAKAARHTFATLYYLKNAGDLGTLSKLLGHTSITTTMIYAHITRDARIAGIKAFDDLL